MTIQVRVGVWVCARACVRTSQVRRYAGGHHAGVVELVDTLALGASGRLPLGVRVPPPALLLCAGATRPTAERTTA